MAGKEDNQILRGLDVGGWHRLQPRLKLVQLDAEQVLYHPGSKISQIYFPTTAVLCMLTIMNNGDSIESASVGSEGASWVSASLGSPTMPCQTMVSVGGAAYSIGAEFVEDEIRQNLSLHNLVSEYAHALLISSLRIGSCNALHSLSQRAARWLLMTVDRTAIARFSTTHEFLASLLGCTRPTVTALLGELEANGGLRISRGQIAIADRNLLESCACECYGVLRDNFATFHDRARRVAEGK
jgi:CRP-like cAMP-binding protein